VSSTGAFDLQALNWVNAVGYSTYPGFSSFPGGGYKNVLVWQNISGPFTCGWFTWTPFSHCGSPDQKVEVILRADERR